MSKERLVTVPDREYRVSPEASAIYRRIHEDILAAIRVGSDDPKVGVELAISLAFTAAIRECMRQFGVETTQEILRQYAETAPQADALNQEAAAWAGTDHAD